MEMTKTFLKKAKKACRELSEDRLHVPLEDMGGYFVAKKKTSLPEGANIIAEEHDNGESIVIYYCDECPNGTD